MTGTALNETVRFWHNINVPAASGAANIFIAENYSMHIERFENILRQTNYTGTVHTGRLHNNIAAVQEFRMTNDNWTETSFTGNEQFRLLTPYTAESGFKEREMPRDSGTIRYVHRTQQDSIRFISYNLGRDFDPGRLALENQAKQFEKVNELRRNMYPLFAYFFVVFCLPTLLMTAIIAISFTRRITHPIVELTEATQRVAEGDFSIQLLTRRNDELGSLIRSFNSMVQDLEKSRAALVRSEKISIWQNMAEQLAHEIKNPLTPIKLSAERVLRRWQSSPDNIGEILESSMMAIIQETEGLSILLNEFRTLSKPMEPSNSLTNLKEPVEELINAYTSSYPKVKFDIDYIQTDIQIKIDKHRLSQVLANIIINAIDAMNGSGLIEIRTDLVKKREICYCRISVKDTGKGIINQEGRLIFTPYFTTKKSGTGLGLPIIERIVNDHGGAIWFDSAEGMGTTFYIDLPLEKTTEDY
jgi:nitrogen fixation/metabolism regulation signal transduction histidine kinase